MITLAPKKYTAQDSFSCRWFFSPILRFFILFMLFSLVLLINIKNEVAASPFITTSAKASALGNAVTADVVGSSGATFNPATLTKVKSGPTGRLREYRFLVLPFPDFEFAASKPPLERDPYAESLSVFAGEDPRDDPFIPEPDRLLFYLPGFGEIADVHAESLSVAAVPLFNTVYRSKNKRFAFTSGIIAIPAGIRFKKAPWMVRENSFSMGSFGINPTIAYQLNDEWSLGFGLTYTAVGARLSLDVRQPQPTLVGTINTFVSSLCNADPLGSAFESLCNSSDLDNVDSLFNFQMEVEDLVNLSANAGLLWMPKTWFSWGLSYRHETKYDMDGDFDLLLSNELFGLLDSADKDTGGLVAAIMGDAPALNPKSSARVKLTIPTQISTGVSLRLTPAIKLNIDYHWKQSSSYNDASLQVSAWDEPSGNWYALLTLYTLTGEIASFNNLGASVGDLTEYLGAKVKDTGNFAYGVEYQYSDRLILRAGYEHRASAYMSDLPLGFPLDSLRVRGFGASYTINKLTTIDISYVSLGMSGTSLAGESVLNSDNIRLPTYALWAGSDLSIDVKVQMMQVGYNKRF